MNNSPLSRGKGQSSPTAAGEYQRLEPKVEQILVPPAWPARGLAACRAGSRGGGVLIRGSRKGICSGLSLPLLCGCGTVVSEPADRSQLGANCLVIVRFFIQPLQFPELTQPSRLGEG